MAHLSLQISELEDRIRSQIALTPTMQLLKTEPGIADMLAILIERELGSISRFPSAQQFSSYAGTTPRGSSSDRKIRYGYMRSESNQCLKWAFIEAANAVAAHHAQRLDRSSLIQALCARACPKRSLRGHRSGGSTFG